jgi:hypothetical protein
MVQLGNPLFIVLSVILVYHRIQPLVFIRVGNEVSKLFTKANIS